MISKANPPRRSDRTAEFKKDWNRLAYSGRYKMQNLKSVMMHLIDNSGPLSAEYQDHPLQGNYVECRECHIGGDWLLIYKLDGSGDNASVVFVRTGTHSELFG